MYSSFCVTVFVVLSLAFSVSGAGKGKKKKGDEEEPSMEERLKRVKNRLKSAEKEMDAIIKQNQKQTTKPSGDVGESLEEIDERMTTIEDDLESILGVQDKLQDRVGKNRLNWSGSYRAVVNNFHFVDDSIDSNITHLELVVDALGQPILDPVTNLPLTQPIMEDRARDIDKWYGSNWVNRMRLTMTFDISENLRFYGQLAVFKYFNELKSEPVTLDMHSNRYPRDPTLRLERAYFDWFVTDWLVLTVGRVAAPEGPPAELKENTVRNATWGVQMVEAEMESVMVTFHLSRFLEGTYLRMFYIPFASHTDFSLSDDTKLFKDAGIDPMHAWGAMVEVKIPGLGENLCQMGFVHVPKFSPRSLPLNVSGIDEPISPSEPTSQDLGSYVMANALVEVKDLFGIGLDVFAAYAMTILKPSDGRMVYEIPVSLPVVHPLTGQTVDTYNGIQPYEMGLASYEEGSGSTNLGHMVYAGLRYTFPFFGSYAPRIGAEFNRGTKYHVPWASASDLLVNRLATKGWAWEVYVIQQLLAEHLFLRIGYLQLIREYEGLYIGPTRKIDQVISNTYVLMDAHW